ncbi:MAG TPA: alpha-glucuronidase family glycosyl hydrolase, partial [Candidatus Angelobacter sp.]|nr:alpha-glucuronidase family glycosyl hydrolase [Candidatus Angelobacter sp.]
LDSKVAHQFDTLPSTVVIVDGSELLTSARDEFVRGIRGILGRTLVVSTQTSNQRAVLLGTISAVQKAIPDLRPPTDLGPDGFWLTTLSIGGRENLLVTATNDRGVLYGVFALLNKIARGEALAHLSEFQQPYAPIRWVDQWDNLDGHIERGYAGNSIFFENGSVRPDLSRAAAYARLLASVGINGCTINNVNADPRLLRDDYLPQLVRVADVFRPWGIQLSISVDLASPKTVGGLDTFDPLDPSVADWWRKKADAIYAAIPDFGGFVVKADSEGRLGPSFYGRTPADAANVIARALNPHHGVVFYRAFVYDHHLDWRDPKNDRAKAAYDNFHPLDGQFEDNVIIQIKHGPIDFQAREPVSPLLSGLEKTNEAIEVQVTQEYTGQQHHLCFLIPMWKEVLDFDLHANGVTTRVKDLVAGKTFHRPVGGFVAVVNVGLDENWLGHPLAMANLYGYARLAWNPNLTAEQIAKEWTILTFGRNPKVAQTISSMLLSSWRTYESYTGPLGMQTLTDILGSHYGPGIESSEENGWGQWHRADHDGVGMDRSVASGTGYVAQYPPLISQLYESPATTPDDLLLFFHHVPYTHVLHSGKTVIQHVYDSHYEGAEHAAEYVKQWQSLQGLIDNDRYAATLARLAYQSGHAIVWRDAVCEYFLRLSGIADAKGRAGHHANRIDAESMQLTSYTAVAVTPWENASSGKAIECASPQQTCSAGIVFKGPSGVYELDVQYFDQNNGESTFRVFINDKLIDEWSANLQLPATEIGGDSSTRRRIPNITIPRGAEIRIEGTPDRDERAALDYLEINPQPR